jgi:hypothetical protein
MFTAWTGFFVYLAYAAIAVGVGAVLVRKRDALARDAARYVLRVQGVTRDTSRMGKLLAV